MLSRNIIAKVLMMRLLNTLHTNQVVGSKALTLNVLQFYIRWTKVGWLLLFGSGDVTETFLDIEVVTETFLLGVNITDEGGSWGEDGKMRCLDLMSCLPPFSVLSSSSFSSSSSFTWAGLAQKRPFLSP